MGKLKAQQEILNLGEQFVKELGLESSVDTFGRWMAHYIAEQITKAKNSKGAEKEKAEKACFETILKVWEHRWLLPSGTRPFESFEPILRLIKKLDPEKKEPFYYQHFFQDNEAHLDETTTWLTAAEEIDKAARIGIAYALEQSVIEVKTKETELWLKNVSNIASDDDTEIIRRLVNSPTILFDKDDDDFPSAEVDNTLKNYPLEKTKSRIEHLEEFAKLNRKIVSALKLQLKQL